MLEACQDVDFFVDSHEVRLGFQFAFLVGLDGDRVPCSFVDALGDCCKGTLSKHVSLGKLRAYIESRFNILLFPLLYQIHKLLSPHLNIALCLYLIFYLHFY